MNRNGKPASFRIILFACIVVAGSAIIFFAVKAIMNRPKGEDMEKTTMTTVRYMSNFSTEITLSSGRTARAEDILFRKEEIKPEAFDTDGFLLSNDANNIPQRDLYTFKGWYKEKECINLWDFSSDHVEKGTNLTLYAGWEKTKQADVDYVEPVFAFDQRVENNSISSVLVHSICNSVVKVGTVDLTEAAFTLLSAHHDDVRGYIDYEINPDCTLDSAVYEGNSILLTYTVAGKTETCPIKLNNVTGQYPVNVSAYETKAQKYEKDIFPEYGIVLCGSSSIEKWSTSKDDLLPLTTVNHGIGGTTVDQWLDGLAMRLVYPYEPRAVVMYLGINNIINAGDSGHATGEKLVKLFNEMHYALPEASFYYILVNTVPGYLDKKAEIDECNRIVTEYAANNSSWMKLSNAGDYLMKESGLPNNSYFLTDGLHMSVAGYRIWGEEVKSLIISNEKAIYK